MTSKLFHFHLSFWIWKVWKGSDKKPKSWISPKRKEFFIVLVGLSFGEKIDWKYNIENAGSLKLFKTKKWKAKHVHAAIVKRTHKTSALSKYNHYSLTTSIYVAWLTCQASEKLIVLYDIIKFLSVNILFIECLWVRFWLEITILFVFFQH